jgi:hypothetical protein
MAMRRIVQASKAMNINNVRAMSAMSSVPTKQGSTSPYVGEKRVEANEWTKFKQSMCDVLSIGKRKEDITVGSRMVGTFSNV